MLLLSGDKIITRLLKFQQRTRYGGLLHPDCKDGYGSHSCNDKHGHYKKLLQG